MALTLTPTNAQTPGGPITVNGAVVPSGSASGPVALATGSNLVTIVVSAPGGGASTTYTVTITRAACVVTASARDGSLPLGADGTATLAPTQVSSTSSTCGPVALALSRTAFSCADVGTPVPVTLTVTDSFGGTATATATVTVQAPLTTPLTALIPASAAVGTTVTVTGTNLAGVTTLIVNGVATAIANLTATGFRFVVPAGASATGNVVLTLPCGQILSQPFGLVPLDTRPAIEAALTLYPNPAQGFMVMQDAPANALVEVLVAVGRRVASAVVPTSGTVRLVLPAGLAAGVYVVRSGAQVQRLAVE